MSDDALRARANDVNVADLVAAAGELLHLRAVAEWNHLELSGRLHRLELLLALLAGIEADQDGVQPWIAAHFPDVFYGFQTMKAAASAPSSTATAGLSSTPIGA